MRTPIEERDIIVFIRIPFCVKAHKGDVFLASQAEREVRNAYMDALSREIEEGLDALEGRRIRAVYVGGGIASTVNPDALARLLLKLRRNAECIPGMELSIRFAPETVGSPSLSALNMASFNRMSIEALSTRDALLQQLGASFRYENIEAAVNILGAFHVPNVDMELLYGIPGQTLTSIRNSMVICTGFRGAAHISLRPYPHGEEEGVSEAERREQFAMAVECLGEKGYALYSAESFARPGYECQFTRCENLGLDRAGFGLGAQSFMDGMSYRNTRDFKTYVEKAGDFEALVRDAAQWDGKALMRRFGAKRLQDAEGFSGCEFQARFGRPLEEVLGPGLEALAGQGLLLWEGDRVKPTTEGLRLNARLQESLWTC